MVARAGARMDDKTRPKGSRRARRPELGWRCPSGEGEGQDQESILRKQGCGLQWTPVAAPTSPSCVRAAAGIVLSARARADTVTAIASGFSTEQRLAF